jgi:transposase
MRPAPEIIEIDFERLESLLLRAREQDFQEEDYETIRRVLEAYVYLTQVVDDKNTTIGRLRKLLFGARTEKTSQVVGLQEEAATAQDQTPPGVVPPAVGSAPAEPAAQESSAEPAAPEPPPKKPGHGRNGADAYRGATRIRVGHPSLQPGDPCLECGQGTVYALSDPGVLIRLVGRPPISATVYELEKLRCNLCGTIFTAPAPAAAGAEKYDATAASMIALLKYGAGLPFNRQEVVQADLEVPLPASTQWDVVSAAAQDVQPVLEELIRQAAQGEVVHNDDTRVKILELMGKRAAAQAFAESGEDTLQNGDERTGLFTSGIVSISEGHTIALFISGNQHAGENLRDVLRKRAAELGPPIQMCDALSRNLPQALETIVANCLAHGRRQFVDINETFPEECSYVLKALRVVYHNDELARERNLSPQERLAFHQAESCPTMDGLKAWLKRQSEERLVEPNSGLGKAINYLRNHWDKLTLFLRQPGAPLDNNICERALKKAILHRKNALFYKTCNGAAVGDLYMSLIHTCELNAANPFNYLTELQRHAKEVAEAPAQWMPWNYRANLAAA